jgi:hypothetical protein
MLERKIALLDRRFWIQIAQPRRERIGDRPARRVSFTRAYSDY